MSVIWLVPVGISCLALGLIVGAAIGRAELRRAEQMCPKLLVENRRLRAALHDLDHRVPQWQSERHR